MIEIEVKGLRELTKKMDKLRLSFKDSRKLIDPATREAIKIPYKAMKRAAPVDTGTLRRAIKMRKKKGRQQIIITKGRGQKNDAWYWHFVEFGHLGKNGLWQSPKKFLKRALGRTKNTAIKKFYTEFKKNVERKVNQLRAIG